MDIIGMTNLQEAKLAREAEICYGTIALVTDYDCWHPEHDAVTVEQIIAYLNQNSLNAQQLIRETVKHLEEQRHCSCGAALKTALLTDPKTIPLASWEKLRLLVEKYIPRPE